MDENINKLNSIVNEIKKVIVGKDEIIVKVLSAILAKGHILLEDIPGVGKTTLALAFSKAMELKQRRLQFTPDVLPTDVVGFNMFSKDGTTMIYKEGAINCNLFLADEINRTSSKTQSALLEVMEEGKVTVDGVTRELPKPFIVMATQNPIGSVGTQLLPESQLDRFMIRLSMGYPDLDSEVRMLKGKQNGNPMKLVNNVITREELLSMQNMVESCFVHDDIYNYVALLAVETRTHELISLGLSPRGSVSVINMAKAVAFIEGRNYVIPQDVKNVFFDVIEHRILLNAKARLTKVTGRGVLEEVLKKVPTPKV